MGENVGRSIGRALRRSQPYQRQRLAGTEQRWNLIQSQLAREDRNLLDVGCNLGVLSAQAAAAGLVTIGIDVENRFVRRARRRYGALPNLAFMRMEVRPDTVSRLPEVDVTLCLSVHHRWARHFGLKNSWGMVLAMMERTRGRFFFEPAGLRSKYADEAPDFVDLDRESIIDRTLSDLSALARDGQVVRCLGETPAVGREPFRLLFVVERPC